MNTMSDYSEEELLDEGQRRIAEYFPRVQAIADQLEPHETTRLLEALASMADQSSGEMVLDVNALEPADVVNMLDVVSSIAKNYPL